MKVVLQPDFHLRFLLHLTDYLGCFPENNYSKENALFNCKKARFEKGNDAKDTELDECLHLLMQQDLLPIIGSRSCRHTYAILL